MTRLEQIQQAILGLSKEEWQALAEWLDTTREQDFDAAIERDTQDGRLGRLRTKAIMEFRAGRTKAL